MRGARWRLRILGVLSTALFFVPLVAPFLQAVTLADTLSAACRGETDRVSAAIGAGGAVLGFLLFLLIEYVWII